MSDGWAESALAWLGRITLKGLIADVDVVLVVHQRPKGWHTTHWTRTDSPQDPIFLAPVP